MRGPNLSGLTIVGASTALDKQKNRGNRGVRTERSRWEIIRDMLTVLTEDKKSKKTRIMQRACLDWRNFQRYFNFLLEEKFVTKCDNPEPESYELTENGKELLKRLKVVGEMLH
ncbi:Winged helix-turn-helix [uncultured archaeon]|nr:Winged helix-turn-helix [uncultured archaeon]